MRTPQQQASGRSRSRSDPHQGTARRTRVMPSPARARRCPSPSPVQNTPKADNMTPTPNLRVFSGTRDSGRWTTAPAASTSAQAASAPRLAGINSPRPTPTAMTMKTTSTPSSSTALRAVMPAAQPRLLRCRFACSARSAASEAKMASSSCNGIMPAARNDALLSQPRPKSSSRIPIASCSK